jgi:hypothetical protein
VDFVPHSGGNPQGKGSILKYRIFFPPLFLFFFILFLPASIAAETNSLRSFGELFPYLGEDRKREAFSEEGAIRSVKKNEVLEFLPAPGSGIDLYGTVMKINPAYLAESLLVIPYQDKVFTRLDAYNALGKVSDLKGRLYRSHTRNAEVPLFQEAVRLENEKSGRAVPDPIPARELPNAETVFIRLKDINFGNSYYRTDMSVTPFGLTYKITNTKNLTYLLFTVLREEKFSSILYIEPLTEGMLVYSMAAADASDFIAGIVDIPSAISKRLLVFLSWIRDNLKTS